MKILQGKEGSLIVYSAEDADLRAFTAVKTYKRRGAKNRAAREFVNLLCAFDIEVTDDDPDPFMYCWQFAFMGAPASEEINLNRGRHRAAEIQSFRTPRVIFGDTWEELQLLLSRIESAMPEGVSCPIYVHNLSYEYAFMNNIINFDSGFLVGGNKIARLDSHCFEWRCSYCYTNKSLYQLTHERVKHAKSKDDLDYSVYREPCAQLTPDEIQYRYNDVAGLVEALYLEYTAYNENVANAVMTSTGHVRKEIQRASDYKLNEIKWNCEQSFAIAEKLHKLFRGGDTHGNRDMIGLIHSGVRGRDKKSSYPCMIVTKRFPVSHFVKMDPDIWESVCMMRNYACFGYLRITGLKIKRNAPDPYIARAKVSKAAGTSCDNGRILYADTVELWLLDLDYRIIADAYTFDKCEVLEAYAAKADFLPSAFTGLVRDFFGRKEELKLLVKKLKKEGKKEAAATQAEEYNKFKNLVNSFYGCLAEWIHADEYQYQLVESGGKDFMPVNHDNIDDWIQELWKRRNKTRLPYQWGVYVTAWARYEYYCGIKACSGNYANSSKFIYGDTDSAKYISTPEIEARFDELNARIRKECEEAPVKGYVDLSDGTRAYMGIWEIEQDYKEFRTWGAKKYAYTDGDGLHITVAGLSKEKGSTYLEKIGGIEAFNTGLVFPEEYSGRTRSIYSESTLPHKKKLRSGKEITTAGYVRILPVTYTLDITNEMLFLIQSLGYSDSALDSGFTV